MADPAPKNPNLINKRVFVHTRTKFGIPDRVFVGVSVLWLIGAGTLFYYLPWYIALPLTVLFAFVLYIPVYIIHQDDPAAAPTWLRAFFNPAAYTHVYSTRRQILLLVPDGDRLAVRSLTQLKEK